MAYKYMKVKNDEGTIWELESQLRLSEKDEFRARLMEATGRKNIYSILKKRPDELKLWEFKATQKVAKEFGIDVELK